VNRPKKLLQLGRLRLQRCELAHEFVHRPSLPFSDAPILMALREMPTDAERSACGGRPEVVCASAKRRMRRCYLLTWLMLELLVATVAVTVHS
jgi:hypothetical protein